MQTGVQGWIGGIISKAGFIFKKMLLSYVLVIFNYLKYDINKLKKLEQKVWFQYKFLIWDSFAEGLFVVVFFLTQWLPTHQLHDLTLQWECWVKFCMNQCFGLLFNEYLIWQALAYITFCYRWLRRVVLSEGTQTLIAVCSWSDTATTFHTLYRLWYLTQFWPWQAHN